MRATHAFLVAAAAAYVAPRTPSRQRPARACISCALPAYVSPTSAAMIVEPAAGGAFDNMQTVSLTLPADVATGPVDVTYLSTACEAQPDKPPLLLLHGFDISSLEYRRLLPLLEQAGLEAYAPCTAGWGFTDTRSLKSVGVEAKRAQMLAFIDEVLGGRAATVVGASLGSSIALDLYLARPEAVESVVMLDPGTFTAPPPAVPEAAASKLVEYVLGNDSVRRSIAKQAYYDKPGQTDDAIRVGSLHLQRKEWGRDSTDWLLSGGYDVAGKMEALRAVRTLTLWGRQDQVIPPAGVVPQLVAALPEGQFRWVEDCGHTPHLEQPQVTADAIAAFVAGEEVAGDADVSALLANAALTPFERLAALDVSPKGVSAMLASTGLEDYHTLDEAAQKVVVGAGAAASLALFFLPIFEQGFIGDLVTSAFTGFGSLSLSALRRDGVGDAARSFGRRALSAAAELRAFEQENNLLQRADALVTELLDGATRYLQPARPRD